MDLLNHIKHGAHRGVGPRLAAATLLLCLLAAPSAWRAARPVAGARAAAPTLPAAINDFFNAVALQDTDVPAPLQPATQGEVTIDQVAAQGGPAIADLLAAGGFLGGWQQAFRNRDQFSLLRGAPAGAAVVFSVFDADAGAAAWHAFAVENAASVGLFTAAAAGVGFDVTATAPLDFAALGDESAAVEITGTATLAGQSAPLVVDFVSVRRGPVQYAVVVAGLTRQQRALGALAQTVDTRVTAALPLLNQ